MTRRRGPLGLYERHWRRRQVERLARDRGLTPAEAEMEYQKIERIADGLEALADDLRGLADDLTFEVSGRARRRPRRGGGRA